MKTSWTKSSDWYTKIVGKEGHYYHQHVVLPGTIKLLNLKKESSLLDLGCGQGVLSRSILPEVNYSGVDNSKILIDIANKFNKRKNHKFYICDATKPFDLPQKNFTNAAAILSVQNMENPKGAFENASKYLVQGGSFVIVLNHPVFRIPRQTSWGIDEKTKVQYRRIDRYLTELKIPLTTNPSQRDSAITWSFHYSLSAYSKMLNDAGFTISLIEEWISDKESFGKYAKMENRSRSEIPLFMAIKAIKA